MSSFNIKEQHVMSLNTCMHAVNGIVAGEVLICNISPYSLGVRETGCYSKNALSRADAVPQKGKVEGTEMALASRLIAAVSCAKTQRD